MKKYALFLFLTIATPLFANEALYKTITPSLEELGPGWKYWFDPTSFIEVNFIFTDPEGKVKTQVVNVTITEHSTPEKAREYLKSKKKQIKDFGRTEITEENDLGDSAFSIHSDNKRYYFSRKNITITAIGLGGPHLTKDVLLKYDSKIKNVN